MSQPVNDTYDFIIVGGHTAGNVVAGRPAENPDVKVLVIEAEAGNPDEISKITSPAPAFELRNSEYEWGYQTTWIDRPDNKRVQKPNPRGKVLDGSSCLNYYSWVRGIKETFDLRSGFAGEAWAWENCKGYFDKARLLRASDTGLIQLELEP